MSEPKGPRQKKADTARPKETKCEAGADDKEEETATGDDKHMAPGTQEQEGEARASTKGTVEIECVNITNLAYNWHALTKRVANVIFVQEHKLKGKALKKTYDDLDEAGWQLLCGPCDNSTKKPNAGVGVLVKRDSGTTVTKGEMHTEDFRIAHEAGRAA